MRHRLARYTYRTVSIFFFLAAIVCWLLTVVSFVALCAAPGFQLALFFYSIVMPILALAMHHCSSDAWRSARYSYPRYDY